MDSVEINNDVPVNLAQPNNSSVIESSIANSNPSNDPSEVIYIGNFISVPPVPTMPEPESIERDSSSAAANFDQNAEGMEVDVNKEDEETNDSEKSDTEEDSGSLCTICYSSYTNSGAHRICCLKCGHLFGKSCIEHWLKTLSTANRKCPTCNAKASLRDVRILYAKTLIALDTSEKDRLIKRLELVEQEKCKLESLLNNSNSKIQMLQEKITMYEINIKQMKENPHYQEQLQLQSGQNNYSFSAKLLNSLKLSERGCRVLTMSKSLSLLLATQESGNPLFPGFGIRKINMHDMRPAPYQNNLHKKEIRDIAFSYHDRSNLLSVSLDCTAKLYDVQSNVAIQTLTVSEPLWSCSYNPLDSHKFYCGSQKGTVFVFDRRYLCNEPEQVIELPDSKTGIISLCSIPPRPGRFMPNGGIMACRLTCVTAIYSNGNNFETVTLPIEGSFLSMKYNESTDNLLISARPSKNFNSPRHIICQLSKSQCGESRNNVDILHTFHGARSPKVLSRSSFIPTPTGDQLVCAYNERDTSIDTWSMISETKLNTRDVYLPEPILDICSFQSNDQEVMVPCLSESKLSILKFGFESRTS